MGFAHYEVTYGGFDTKIAMGVPARVEVNLQRMQQAVRDLAARTIFARSYRYRTVIQGPFEFSAHMAYMAV